MQLTGQRGNATVRKAVRCILNPLLTRWTASKDYDLRRTLVIAGTARSGTTWLAELVGSAKGTAIMFEPEHLGNVPEAKAIGFGWHPCLSPDDRWPAGEVFLERVLKGRVLNAWTTSFMPVSHAVRPRRWVVKFIRANLLLGWLTVRFPIPPPVLILRHPCATVASQRQQGWIVRNPPRAEAFFRMHPHLQGVLDGLTDEWEFHAALWCIETYAPLALSRPHPYLLITYEQLVRHGEATLERVFDHWGVGMPAEVRAQVHRPSQTTKAGSALLRREDPLSGWQRTLTAEQIARILNVVRRFGLDFYGADPEPDYDRLFGPAPLGGEARGLRSCEDVQSARIA